MNAGRLHAVLELIRRDYERSEIIAKLQATVEALERSISSVAEADAQAFREALTALYAAIDQSTVGSLTPSQFEILKEIGASDKVGAGLKNEIQNTLDSNAVTPANALAELQRILGVVSHLSAVVSQILAGFDELKVPYEHLEPGESEIGFVVPWSVVDANVAGLQKNLHQLDRALKTFGEVAEENPKSPEVRSVGSSALQLFLQSTPAMALCFATAIERLCALYKQILEIKILRKKVREQSLPEAVSASIEAHENQIAGKEIGRIADDLIQEFWKGSKERGHELRTAMEDALRFLAAQIDAGVEMEVSAEPPRPKEVAESEGEPVKSQKAKRALEEARQTTARIQRAGVAMRTLPKSTQPILALDFSEEGKKKRSAHRQKPAK